MNKILGGLTLFFFLLAVSVIVFNLGIQTTKASEWTGSWKSLAAEVAKEVRGEDGCGPEVQEKVLASVNAFIWHTNQMFADPNATPADFRKLLSGFSLAKGLADKEQSCLGWDGHIEGLITLGRQIQERL